MYIYRGIDMLGRGINTREVPTQPVRNPNRSREDDPVPMSNLNTRVDHSCQGSFVSSFVLYFGLLMFSYIFLLFISIVVGLFFGPPASMSMSFSQWESL